MFLQNFFHTIRFADIIDILIIAAFIYVFIVWLKRSTSSRILITVTLFAFIYLLANVLEMYMTEILIKYLFIVILIALVVVFQADIRRLVDLLGNWKIFKSTKPSEYSETIIDTLTEAITRLADNKTGALIAIKGNETWDRPVHGGIPLHGKVSAPLLYSIFNKYSPGHDGAVLIEGDQIEKFGAHLTLSVNHEELGSHGTRHAAALGLSENCDALVIAVSEEKGTISIAEKGKLRKVHSGSDIKKILSEFWDKHYSGSSSLVSWWKRKNIQAIILALLLAVMAWFIFAYQSEVVYRTYVVPLEFRNLPENFAIEDPSSLESRITFSGSEQAFRLLDPAALSVSLNLENIEQGENQILISENDFTLPSDIFLYDAEPREITLTARQMKEVYVPVEVRTSGKVKNRRKVESISVNPEKVKILIRENAAAPKSIYTETIELNKINKSSTVNVKLIPPTGVRIPNNERKNVTVIINIDNIEK